VLIPRRLLNRTVHATWRWIERAGAIAPGTDLAEEFGSFGTGACLSFPVSTLFGAASIHVGEGTLIGRHCSLSVGYGPDDADLPPRGLVIGDRCVVGSRTALVAHESITIGDDVWFGQDVYVSDASHGYQDPEVPIGLQMGAHQPVTIGAGSWIGHGAVILPGTTIGRNVVVAAGSVVRGTVEDHAVVGGVPAKVIRRLVPGVGWAQLGGSGDARPIWSTDEVAEVLAAEA
jgi:acetyltransferase-like isoleucine patch superfamily enzyme